MLLKDSSYDVLIWSAISFLFWCVWDFAGRGWHNEFIRRIMTRNWVVLVKFAYIAPAKWQWSCFKYQDFKQFTWTANWNELHIWHAFWWNINGIRNCNPFNLIDITVIHCLNQLKLYASGTLFSTQTPSYGNMNPRYELQTIEDRLRFTLGILMPIFSSYLLVSISYAPVNRLFENL